MKGAGWGAAALAGTVATHICPTQDHQHHLYFIRSELNIKLKTASYRSFISAFQHTAEGFDMFIFSWMGKQLTYNLLCDCWEQESRALWVFWSVSCNTERRKLQTSVPNRHVKPPAAAVCQVLRYSVAAHKHSSDIWNNSGFNVLELLEAPLNDLEFFPPHCWHSSMCVNVGRQRKIKVHVVQKILLPQQLSKNQNSVRIQRENRADIFSQSWNRREGLPWMEI